jgi:hypothetical protein
LEGINLKDVLDNVGLGFTVQRISNQDQRRAQNRLHKMLLAPGLSGALYLKLQKIQISKVQKNKNKNT